MADLTATPPTIVVDPGSSLVAGFSSIQYEKEPTSALVMRYPAGGWAEVNPLVLLGTSDADERGKFTIQLRPGEVFEAAITDGAVPDPYQDMPPFLKPYIRVGCVRQQKGPTPLFTDHLSATGGTWITVRVATSEATQVLYSQVSLDEPVTNAKGLPFMDSPMGRRISYARSNDGHIHDFEHTSLLPGQRYFCLVVVMDNQGNWDWKVLELVTKKRKVTVSFPGIRVFNDGDWATTGEAALSFSVGTSLAGELSSLHDFSWSENNFDDWGEAENGPRPYPLGFVHQGALESVGWDTSTLWVWSNGAEDDSTEVDRAFGGRAMPFPEGRDNETVVNKSMSFKCSPSNGGSLNYDVDVVFSVEYEL